VAEFPEPDRAALAAGIEWLYRTAQPEGAILTHHGSGCPTVHEARSYGFCPRGGADLPAITLNAKGWSYAPDGDLIDGVMPGEMAATAEALAELGVQVRKQWNGEGCPSGGFGLTEPAHPSLIAAVNRYRAGCPVHGTVFCGWQGSTEAERNCTWYADGNHLVVQPKRLVPGA
jgi:hypothetical protein